ncbi:Transcription termination factor mterf4, chloroplastic [Stylosanthes scabra]|uniref:Transcription termination factor mterf4, chloroplastic n=1 Tax=Stylosanthes scabra TaxID=79078 RepID=A0ABU6UGF3_9FABA|nr:Transcription termination factor mterf4, chloroplastic [Stylosanthes scabra]
MKDRALHSQSLVAVAPSSLTFSLCSLSSPLATVADGGFSHLRVYDAVHIQFSTSHHSLSTGGDGAHHAFDGTRSFESMKVMSFSGGITAPSSLFAPTEMPILAFGHSKLSAALALRLPCNCMRRMGLVTKLQYSVANRASSASRHVDSPASNPESRPVSRRRGGGSSLYIRPSLSVMNKDREEMREMVYEFLRGIGIVPDELDGLELPVTVDVMRERIDFLHNLGLTIEDINNYPLVLGCSVKKNMIPVLDYLGKLGVRKSTFTQFLRRYPQVLHASVVVDLMPVVKYLQGMDIKPNDIPRVLERYPEVLGFKLEGTMSTSVAYLVGIGVSRREVGGVLTRYPEILGMRVGRVIKPFVEFLESLGIPRLALARLIEQKPYILGFGLDEKVKPNVKSLEEFNVRRTSLSCIIAQYPDIVGIDLKPKLVNQSNLLNSVLNVDPDDFGRVVEKMPQIVSLTKGPMLKHVDFLKDCGFSLEQMRKMIVGCPQLLALNIDIMKLSFDYFQAEMKRPLEDLVIFPAFFTYGLESTVKPRHKVIAKKGLKCSLSWMLNCSDEKFEQRMEYDTIDMEEMEMEPSFDMDSLMQPRNDESGSDYEDYDDSDDD